VKIDDFLRREIEAGSFPGAAWAVGSRAGLEQQGVLGHSIVVPLRIEARTGTIWDCASLTKPLITTTLVLQAIDEGLIRLDDEYRGYTYRELLTHTSGLRAWLPLYAFDDPLDAIATKGPEHDRGTTVVYSDLNFVLLWYALTEIFGGYVAAARERIFEPLGLLNAMFNPPPSLRPRIAATEWGQRWEVGMCAARSIPFRGFREGLIWGDTHDGNSFHAGGTAGNAGLFATVRDVFRIAQAFANGELVPSALVEEATRNQTGIADRRGYGWDLPTEGSAATSMLSRRAYGHTGFTGTSVWIDPDADRIMVLLTNRVHPCAAPVGMQGIRGEFHRLASV
jgi:CubicO group peptidase (beta-lactamase class C family)